MLINVYLIYIIFVYYKIVVDYTPISILLEENSKQKSL